VHEYNIDACCDPKFTVLKLYMKPSKAKDTENQPISTYLMDPQRRQIQHSPNIAIIEPETSRVYSYDHFEPQNSANRAVFAEKSRSVRVLVVRASGRIVGPTAGKSTAMTGKLRFELRVLAAAHARSGWDELRPRCFSFLVLRS
jgi:hypothetical protein